MPPFILDAFDRFHILNTGNMPFSSFCKVHMENGNLVLISSEFRQNRWRWEWLESRTPTVIRRLCWRDSSQSSMGPTWPLNVDASQLRSKMCIQPYESQMIIWLLPFVVHFMLASYQKHREREKWIPVIHHWEKCKWIVIDIFSLTFRTSATLPWSILLLRSKKLNFRHCCMIQNKWNVEKKKKKEWR